MTTLVIGVSAVEEGVAEEEEAEVVVEAAIIMEIEEHSTMEIEVLEDEDEDEEGEVSEDLITTTIRVDKTISMEVTTEDSTQASETFLSHRIYFPPS